MMCSQGMDYNVSLWGCPSNILFAFKFHITLKQLVYLFLRIRMHFFSSEKKCKDPTNTSLTNHLEGSGVSKGYLLLDYSMSCFHGFR